MVYPTEGPPASATCRASCDLEAAHGDSCGEVVRRAPACDALTSVDGGDDGSTVEEDGETS